MKTITMFGKAVLCLSTLHFYSVTAQGECTDLRGRLISHGLHYVPGPDTCTLCVCDNGLPKVCKAVLCSPPQDCRSFRVGTTCCEFICLDDVVKPADATEANVRVAAGGATAVVLVTVALVVYRVRKQKRRRTTHTDDQRSLTSIGYISGSMGYMGGTCETSLGAWKPPGNYLPRGEAPPPYDEVIAQCRADNARISNEAFHRSYPTTVEALARPEDGMQCTGHGYVNIPRPVQQIANPQNCYNAPLLQPVYAADVNNSQLPHHAISVNMSGLRACGRLTGSLGAISGRLSVAREPEPDARPRHVPGFYSHLHPALHRTIPRISTTGACLELGAGEVRRSFHRAGGGARRDTRRSVPRHLDLAAPEPRHLDLAGPAERQRAEPERQPRARAASEDNMANDRPSASVATRARRSLMKRMIIVANARIASRLVAPGGCWTRAGRARARRRCSAARRRPRRRRPPPPRCRSPSPSSPGTRWARLPTGRTGSTPSRTLTPSRRTNDPPRARTDVMCVYDKDSITCTYSNILNLKRLNTNNHKLGNVDFLVAQFKNRTAIVLF